MKIQLLYFEDCPNWRRARLRLRDVLAELPDPPEIELLEVATPEQADDLGFRGSPTFLVDGRDLFETEEEPHGLACRIYQTPTGPSGSPTLDQLRAALLG